MELRLIVLDKDLVLMKSCDIVFPQGTYKKPMFVAYPRESGRVFIRHISRMISRTGGRYCVSLPQSIITTISTRNWNLEYLNTGNMRSLTLIITTISTTIYINSLLLH